MKNIVLLIIMSALLNGCCFGNPDCVVSPERIKKPVLSGEIKKLKDICKSQPGSCNSADLRIIGHGAGSFRHYAMDVTYDGGIEGNNRLLHIEKAENVNDLMDQVFANKDINAIEIDVHVPLLSHPLCDDVGKGNCAFVMHNKPKWDVLDTPDSEAYEYMKKNTLTSILSHFLMQGYDRKDKRIYLELKAPLECMSPKKANEKECKHAPTQVAKIVKKVIGSSNAGNWLTVVSFSASSLITFQSQVGDKVKYAFIAGYDDEGFLGSKAYFAQCKGAVPHFSNEMKKFIYKTSWIDLVWFSTKAIAKPNEVFMAIDSLRDKHCPKPGCNKLKYSVSSYDNTKFKKIMSDFTPPLFSVMIDIDD